MRRLLVVITAIVLTGVGLAAWGTVASAREAGPSELERAQQKLPPLPANIKSRAAGTSRSSATHRRSGTSARGARMRASTSRSPAGSRSSPSARGTASRCPASPRREGVVPDHGAGRPRHRDLHLQHRSRDAHRLLARVLQGDGRMLVQNNASIRRSRPAGKTIATTSGSVYDRWVKNCTRTRSSSSRTASRTHSWLSATAARTR